MPELSSLTRPKPVSIDIDLGDGDTVSVVFDRNRVTTHWAQNVDAQADADDPMALSEAIAHVLMEWNVTADGQPFPPTATNVSMLSLGAQKALLHRVIRAAVPSDAEGKSSASLSPIQSSVSADPPRESLNGTETSTLGAPSAYPSPT